jgi:hypothetical protein
LAVVVAVVVVVAEVGPALLNLVRGAVDTVVLFIIGDDGVVGDDENESSRRGGNLSLTLSNVLASSNDIFFLLSIGSLVPMTTLAILYI